MTGLRWSEVCGLQWSDIDLEGGRLPVRRAVVLVDGWPVVKATKTTQSRSTVELDEATAVVLRDWRRRQLEDRLRAGAAWEPGDWAFTNEVGVPVHPDSLSRWVR